MDDKAFINSLLKCSVSELTSNLGVDHIIKIEGWENLNTKKVEKLGVNIICLADNEKYNFNIDNDENIEVEAKLKQILIDAIDKKYIKKDSIALFMFDKSASRTFNFGMLVLEVSRVLYRIARFRLTEFMENEKVLEKVMEIAEEIRTEGREGQHVGTLFVIGTEEEVSPHLKPLILNPFYGYPEELRDIISNDLNESIKNYAQLDGAFFINTRGIVISAGTYIDVDTTNVKKYYGWGTKHLAAVAITEKTKSIAVLVSESGGLIKLFKNGKLILKY